MTLSPTGEQQAIIDAYQGGADMVIEAGAGTGKTSTLKMLGQAAPSRRGIYIAYNKAIAVDAKQSFPANVHCSTAHALAFQAIGKQYSKRLNGPRQPARIVAQLLGAGPVRIDESLMLSGTQVARIAVDTVSRFCNSADPEVAMRHVPHIDGIDAPDAKARLRAAVAPLARKAWADLVRLDGKLKFQHDHYLKIWQLSGPILDTEVVFLDEAQDANPLIADIVERQTHAQQVMVGDASQAIYQWRGAVDALSRFHAPTRLQLSESFRFGQPIADEANRWLGLLGAKLRLTGRAAHTSEIHRADTPLDADAILCRSNAGAIDELMRAAEEGKRAALVGGGQAIKMLAEAALQLQQGQPTWHPELVAFSTWGQIREYVEQETAGSDLKVFVRLIDDYGTQVVIDTVDGLVDERYAQVVVSTAHKAKGREWDRVRVASDFREPKDDADGKPGKVPDEDAMLAYVTVTRARKVLDRGGLSWIDKRAAQLVEHIARATVAAPAADIEGNPLPAESEQAPVSDFTELHPVGQQQLAVTGAQLHLGQHIDDAHQFITEAAELAGHTEPPTREQVAALVDADAPIEDLIAFHVNALTRKHN